LPDGRLASPFLRGLLILTAPAGRDLADQAEVAVLELARRELLRRQYGTAAALLAATGRASRRAARRAAGWASRRTAAPAARRCGLSSWSWHVHSSLLALNDKHKRSTCVLLLCAQWSRKGSIAVMIGFIRPLGGHAEVFGLVVRQHCQFHSEVLQVEPRHFLVELLREDVDLFPVFALVGPQRELCKDLIGKRR